MKSDQLYRVSHWGSPHFKINDKGELCSVLNHGKESFSLLEIVKEMEAKDICLPAIIRFPDILRERIYSLTESFSRAIEATGYHGSYRGCFPVKVNQKKDLISEIAEISEEIPFGFEAGTKAELAIAIAHYRNRESKIVCNGYKDTAYIDLALFAIKAGINLTLVVERTDEVPLIVERSRRLGISPRLGVRIRITSGGTGRWASTSGGQGLFGLTALELVRTIDELNEAGMIDCLKMLHFHQGSQIPHITAIRRGIDEAASIFSAIWAEGAKLEMINVGGGLAIDYEGSGIASQSSRNYSLDDYCRTVVEGILERLDQDQIPHPDIISESGRSIAAHSSVLIFNVFGGAASQRSRSYEPHPSDPKILHRLYALLDEIRPDDPVAVSRMADSLLESCHDEMQAGTLSLRHLAAAQRLRSCIADRIREVTSSEGPRSATLSNHLSEYYFANFSIFQSIPDTWAVGQLFPVMPIHRLNEAPTRHAVIADITCDCDGKIKRYIGSPDETETLPVHPLIPGEPYLMGVFLVGSYQETLGDIHNLLGPTSLVTVRTSEKEISIEPTRKGAAISEILKQVNYRCSSLCENFDEMTRDAVERDQLTREEKSQMDQLFRKILDSSSYLIRNPNHQEM